MLFKAVRGHPRTWLEVSKRADYTARNSCYAIGRLRTVDRRHMLVRVPPWRPGHNWPGPEREGAGVERTRRAVIRLDSPKIASPGTTGLVEIFPRREREFGRYGMAKTWVFIGYLGYSAIVRGFDDARDAAVLHEQLRAKYRGARVTVGPWHSVSMKWADIKRVLPRRDNGISATH